MKKNVLKVWRKQRFKSISNNVTMRKWKNDEKKSVFLEKRLADERFPGMETQKKAKNKKCFRPRKNMQKSRNQTFFIIIFNDYLRVKKRK